MISRACEGEDVSIIYERPGISAVLVCFNEEDNIGPCLESVKWCDEIVVVDSFSTDKTLEICSRYTDLIIQRSWKGYVDQVSFALTQATREWVLLIDADERVSAELTREIEEALSSVKSGVAAFRMPRLVHYLGKWWRRGGWYPDYKTRLFRRESGRCGGLDPHPRIQVSGAVCRLKNPLYHFSYRDMTDHIERINRFTSISAQEMKRHGRQWTWMDNIFRPAARFLRFYVLKGGFLEGFPGFFVAVTAAYYVFLKYAKLRDLELKELTAGAEPGAVVRESERYR